MTGMTGKAVPELELVEHDRMTGAGPRHEWVYDPIPIPIPILSSGLGFLSKRGGKVIRYLQPHRGGRVDGASCGVGCAAMALFGGG